MFKCQYLIFLLFLLPPSAYSQNKDTVRLTIDEAIALAQTQSPDILQARHNFRSSYWNYCYYKANYLPSLNFRSTPNFNHWINTVTLENGRLKYVDQNRLTTEGYLSLSQNVALTGGTVSLESSVQRIDIYGSERYHSYNTNLFSISYSQSLFGHNSLKWERKVEPLRFEEAKRNYVETLELVAARGMNKFFYLANAQTDLNIARTNYANADTLYSFAKRRYDIGTISENEMLQLEIQRLNSETSMMNSKIYVDEAMQELISYLGLSETSVIEVIIEDKTPDFVVDMEEAMTYAIQNNPDFIAMERRKIESDRDVSSAKAQRGLKADIYTKFGLSQTGEDFKETYRSPLNQQYVQIGFSLPILDWGRGKGRVRMAESNRDIVHMQIEQDKVNFEMNVRKAVKQFNIQGNKVNIAAKTDQTADRRYTVARRLYMQGKSTILDLNSAIEEKDAAKRGYVSALQSYWGLFYTLRSITLYDFEKNTTLTEDYELLLK